jgi:metal transporter CNNM
MDFGDDNAGYADMRDIGSWYQLGGAVVCVICAAFAAGLTVGLMSLDPLELEVKRRVGTPEERKHAEKICPLIAPHHRLLVTLLLFNSIANEALPIFLSGLVPGYVAVLLSVTAILIFGEIIPSAIFTGPNQIIMAAHFSGFVYFLMGVFWPIAYPIGKVLDKWLGHNSFKRYTREELSTLVDLQREVGVVKHRRPPGSHSGSGGGGGTLKAAKEKELGESMRAITVDEATIVAGVLKCHAKKICDALKPMDVVYTLCEEDILDENKLCEIMACGYSRIPVHSARGRQDIRGFLLVKRLIVLDPADRRPVRTLPLRQPIVVSPTGSLLELINVFQEGRSHMAIVSPCPDLTRQALRSNKPLEGRIAPIGIITLEDLFEEILQEEIYDEHDDRVSRLVSRLVFCHSLSLPCYAIKSDDILIPWINND